jgi:hypothetical protein
MRNMFALFRSGVPQDFFVGCCLALFVSCLLLCSPQKAHAAGNGCVPTTNPGACDDGTGPTVCTALTGFSVVHHLTVTGTAFASTGACIYTFNQKGTLKGDAVAQSGSNGTSPSPVFNAGYTAGGLRTSDVGWDSDWAQTGNGFPGNIMSAAGKMGAVLDWINSNIRGVGATTPFCAWGGSQGSSAVLYALTHYGEGDSKLDHVQVQAATPFARIDVLCNPNVGPMANTVCPDVKNVAPNQYPGPRLYLHNNDCMTSSVTQTELDAWRAQSIVSSTEQHKYTKTTLSAFYCQNQPNKTVPQGTYFFGVNNTYINIDVPVDFLKPDGTVYCPANTACHPMIYCAPTTSTCVGEIAFQDPQVKALEVADMVNNCVQSMHPAAAVAEPTAPPTEP